MITDRVGDFITRLKNAAQVGKREISVPHSAHLLAIAKKLKELGYLEKVEVEGEVKKVLKITLAMDESGDAVIKGVKRISKPGRRLYLAHDEANSVKGGMGSRIISTPAGIVTDREARKVKAGGENMFEIW